VFLNLCRLEGGCGETDKRISGTPRLPKGTGQEGMEKGRGFPFNQTKEVKNQWQTLKNREQSGIKK